MLSENFCSLPSPSSYEQNKHITSYRITCSLTWVFLLKEKKSKLLDISRDFLCRYPRASIKEKSNKLRIDTPTCGLQTRLLITRLFQLSTMSTSRLRMRRFRAWLRSYSNTGCKTTFFSIHAVKQKLL